MFFKRVLSHRFVFFFLIVILAIFTRFVKLDWGDGYYFHPDENNMASAVTRLVSGNLNPDFFAYGQLPLYLAYFSLQLVSLVAKQTWLNPITFPQAILALRFWSAAFSLISVYLIYKISQRIFYRRSLAYILTLLVIFSPGLIQLAHFGTTESLLIFVFLFNLLFSLSLIKKPSHRTLTGLALVSGIGLASKITSLLFTTPVFIAILLMLIIQKVSLKWAFLSVVYYLSASLMIALVLSPFNLLDFPDFVSTMRYETSVATGKMPVFYTSQFLDSTAYVFQLKNIFPYVLGLPVWLYSLLGIFFLFIHLSTLLVKKQLTSNKASLINWLVILIPSFIIFIYTGQLYTKWTRFASPIFPVFPILAVYFISRLKSRYWQTLLVMTAILPGIFFLRLYMAPDIRLQATDWINANIPASARLLSESGNVINLPLQGQHSVAHFDFYNLDAEPQSVDKLATEIAGCQYIIVPSRRIFKNQTAPRFPVSQKYYDALFSGQLGFQLLTVFSPNTDIILNPENAEETWTVFDRPTIRLFQKTRILNINEIEEVLKT